jgi:hypothetical protein
MSTHSFSESLAKSHRAEDASWWLDVYRKAFPTLVAAPSVRKDGWAQRAGIDRQIILECGRVIPVDEKVRYRKYSGDILLEFWSDFERQEAGWAAKPLRCEFIAYAFAPSGVCYMFPTLTLQAACRANAREWVSVFKYLDARNKDERTGRAWTTRSVAIPIDTLMTAIAGAMSVSFTPVNQSVAA